MNARRVLPALLLLFVGSGCAALIYEIVWFQLLQLVIGSSAVSIGVLLGTFMGGMCLGSLFLPRMISQRDHPLRIYAYLELAIGAAGILLLFGMPLLGGLYFHWGGGGVTGILLRGVAAAICLLPPTLAMGATFVLMARIQIRSDADVRRETGAFYGANTLGAAAGALLGPFVLMPALGFTRTLLAAAALEAVAAALALRWLSSAPRAETTSLPRPRLASERVLWVAFLVGFAGLALEVELLRILTLWMGASVYAFALVLAVFLAGLGLGSRASRLFRARAGDETRALFRIALAIAPCSLAGLGFLRWRLGESDLFGNLANHAPAGASALQLWLANAASAGLALLPPALAFGLALPAAAGALVARQPGASRERALGALYAFDTAGSLLGSLAAAFVLVPALGPRLGLVAALAPAVLAALLLAGGRALEWTLATGVATALAVLVLAPPRDGAERVLVLESDAHTTAAVEEIELAGRAVRSLRVNGKVEATTAPIDVRLQQLLAYIPGLLAGDVRRALVIGLGSGMTAGSLLDLPSIERVTVVEISSAVRECARRFAEWNRNIVGDPRAAIVIADGRHALRLSPERFDLVTSDPVHPWTRGSSDLYTLEHFTAMAAHLAPGGVASQWLPLYELSTLDLQTMIATWCAAFAHTSAWLSAYDLVLVGSNEPLAGAETLATRAFPPAVGDALARIGIHSGAELCALAVADDGALRAFVRGVEPMRDDRPVIEFRAPLSYLAGYSVEVLRWAGRDDFVDSLPEPSRERAREVRRSLARFLDDLPYGLSAAVEAYERDLLALPALAAR